jgi:hypothetical protein
MSDFYGVNWGPGGSGSDYYPPQPWAFGDGGPGDPYMQQQFELSDAIWRDQEARAAAAAALYDQRAAAQQYAPAPAESLPPATKAAPAELPAALRRDPFDTGTRGGLYTKDGAVAELRPRRSREHRSAFDAAPAVASLSAPAEVYVPPAAQSSRLLRGAGVALGLASLVAAARFTVFNGDEPPRHAAPVAPAEQPANFACDVSGIEEMADGRASITLRVPANSKTAYVGNAKTTVIAELIPGRNDAYSFNAAGLHSQTISAAVGSVFCKGTFNLGKPGPGDEHFVAG